MNYRSLSWRRRVFALLAVAVLARAGDGIAQPAAPLEADVLVYDSTPAGIASAIAAARAGRRVILVTEERHVGGMHTSGLGNTNAGQRDTVGGLAREFHNRILALYQKKYGAGSEQVKACSDGFHFEPHVAETVYLHWLAEAGIRCLTDEVVLAVQKEGTRLVSIRTNRQRSIKAAIFIDASYDGDLLKMAGCSYRVGREASKEYGETLAGVRYPPEKLGQADEKTQAFDYRLCLTDDPGQQVPFRKPAGYDADHYAFHAAKFRHKPPATLRAMLPLNPMPNRTTDSRTGEWVGGSWAYPEANRDQRRLIAQQHRDYSAGYLWFLLTDASVPAALRQELSRWGHAKREFADNNHWPYRLYVRESRRLVGQYVMTQRDVTLDRFKPDAVALGSFYLDVHSVQMVPATEAVGGLVPEGNIGNVRVKPYEIPYCSLLPRRQEVENLLVPVCMSASHVAYSTIRMEPVFMMLGHAAGLAAALSLEKRAALHELSAETLKARLVEQKQVLDARPFTREWPFRGAP